MRRLLELSFFTLFLGFFCACATLKEQVCSNTEHAYEKGYNDAKNSQDMDSDQFGICTPEDQGQLKAEYRRGYDAAAKEFGLVNKLKTIFNVRPPEQCIDMFGQHKCGYNCVAMYGQVACGQNPDDNCIAQFGQLKCGHNCRAEMGSIHCD